jgi:hypothetical protein
MRYAQRGVNRLYCMGGKRISLKSCEEEAFPLVLFLPTLYSQQTILSNTIKIASYMDQASCLEYFTG